MAKPKLTYQPGDRITQNTAVNASRGLAPLMHFAVKCELEDVAQGLPSKGREIRIRDAIVTHFNCSRDAARRAMQRAKIWLAERFNEELPTRRAEVCRQLQRIADAQEEQDPRAAIAALAEQARIIGLHAPMKLEVSQGQGPPTAQEFAQQLDAILGALNDEERAAVRVVLAGIERAKAEGRLALPAGKGDQAEDENIEDAEIVTDPAGVEPGAN